MDSVVVPDHTIRGWGRRKSLTQGGTSAAIRQECDGAPVRPVGGRVLVLNASYEPINVCTVRRAAVLLLKARAELIETGDGEIHSELFAFSRPTVIRLVTYVRVPRNVHRRKITRKAVLARDDWTCQYCGTRSRLTVDHVIPRSRGGTSGWDNIVTACAPCNRRKGNRMPDEISMHPACTPKAPGPNIFIRIASPRVPASWEPYLAATG